MGRPRVSVIVPVYNVKRYLDECLVSVLAQTLGDIEVVCVDDGSTDGSGEILDEYAAKDSRVRVIHKGNSGYGHSINVGLDAARGEYVGIVESDDSVEPEFYETLHGAAASQGADVVKSQCHFCWDKHQYRFRTRQDHLVRYFGKAIPRTRLWLRCQFFMNTWTGLYRREFLLDSGIRHHESPGASYQDNGFWMQTMVLADRAVFIDYAGYNYRQDNEASSIRDGKKAYAMSDEYEWLAGELAGRASEREMDAVNTFRLTRGYWNLYRIDDSLKREFCDRLLSDYGRHEDALFKDIYWQDKFEEIRSDPDGYCDGIIRRKSEATSRIRGSRSVIIYGAGSRGQKLFRLACNHGWADRLQCFIETETPQADRVGDVPVYRMNDPGVDYGDALVIVSAAAGSRMAGEMGRSLGYVGATNVMDSDILLDNFYMIC